MRTSAGMNGKPEWAQTPQVPQQLFEVADRGQRQGDGNSVRFGSFSRHDAKRYANYTVPKSIYLDSVRSQGVVIYSIMIPQRNALFVPLLPPGVAQRSRVAGRVAPRSRKAKRGRVGGAARRAIRPTVCRPKRWRSGRRGETALGALYGCHFSAPLKEISAASQGG